MQYLKGKTSHKLLMEFPHLRRQFWGEAFVGQRVLCNEQRECNGRSDSAIHSDTRVGTLRVLGGFHDFKIEE